MDRVYENLEKKRSNQIGEIKMALNLPHIQPFSFSRIKGKRVVAQYVITDKKHLDSINNKYFLNSDDIGNSIVPVTSEMLQNTNILEDYQQVMKLCKTYIADPEIFELCREIENRIVEIIESRFLLWDKDIWLSSVSPISLLNLNEEESI